MANASTGSEYDQMGIRKGIETHREEGLAAVIREYEQIRDTYTVRAVRAQNLTDEQKAEALELLTLIKKKRCGKIKGRVCADGRKETTVYKPK